MKYFKAFLIIFIAGQFLTTSVIADNSNKRNSPGRNWNRQWGTKYDDIAQTVAVDQENFIYVAGTHSSTKGDVGFLIKRDNNGNMVWEKYWRNYDRLHVQHMAISGDGYIYVAGCAFSSVEGKKVKGGNDIFLMKWDKEGNKIWTSLWGTPSYDTAKEICVDSKGRITIAGAAMANGDLGVSIALQFSPEGKLNWVQQWRTKSESIAQSLALDEMDNIYVTGYAIESFDKNKALGKLDIFIISLTPAGKKIWSKQMGSPGLESGYDILYDQKGFLYLLKDNESLKDNLFLTKLDKKGNVIFEKNLIFPGRDRVGAAKIAMSSDGNIYLCGISQRYINERPVNGGEGEMVLAAFDAEGNLLNEKVFGIPSIGNCFTDIVIDSSGRINISGHTDKNLENTNNIGYKDAFLIHIEE